MHSYGNAKEEQTPIVHLRLDKNAQRYQMFSPAEMRPVFEKIENCMRLLGFTHKDIFAMTFSVHEAVTNAFRHGNRYNPAKCVWVAYLVTPAEVLVEVEDQGSGFDTDCVPNPLAYQNCERPSGRGIFLMRVYCTWVRFNPEGNQVMLCRRRSVSVDQSQGPV